jgi:hypothetical protein
LSRVRERTERRRGAAAAFAGMLLALATGAGMAQDAGGPAPHWAVDPSEPGTDLPPTGRSLFDAVFAERGAAGVQYSLPFPFAALRERLVSRTGMAPRELLVPLGRSLQRNAANPDFFLYPRVVLAVDRRPAAREPEAGDAARFSDRLYIGYQERAAVLEVISYNEDAGRFEFQIVRDYRAGATPDVRYAKRTDCVPCHQNQAPLFSRPLWDETNANADVAALLAATGRDYHGVPVNPGVDTAEEFDAATDRANLLAVWQRIWSDGCGAGAPGARCRADALLAALRYRLAGGRSAAPSQAGEKEALERALRANWQARWPGGLAVPNPDVPNRKLPLFESQRGPRDLGVLLGTPVGTDRIVALAAVRPDLEPFRARAPLDVWPVAAVDAALVERFVDGIAQWFTAGEIRALDRYLAGRAGSGAEDVALSCLGSAQPDVRGRTAAYRLECRARDDGVAAQLTVYLDDATQQPDAVVLQRLESGAAGSLRGVAGAVSGAAPTRLRLAFDDAATGLRARTPAGTVLLGATLRWSSAGLKGESSVTLRLGHDLAPLEAALARLAAAAEQNGDAALAPGPLRVRAVAAELFAALGAEPPTDCCALAAELPPPRRAD